MQILVILIIALLCEALWETLKMVWQEGKLKIDRVGSLVIGIGVCFITGIDVFPLVGIPITYPYVGAILTGIIISRGSNFVHDLLIKVQNLSKKE